MVGGQVQPRCDLGHQQGTVAEPVTMRLCGLLVRLHGSRRRPPPSGRFLTRNSDRGSGMFDGQRVLVTGGAGFIGSHLCDRLLQAGHEVLCVDNFYSSTRSNVEHLLKHPRFELIRHDVTFPLYVEVDEIYHLACPASPLHYQRDPVQTTKTAVHGSINMLGLAKRTKAPILLTSTSEVYGDPEVHPQREDYWGHVNPIGVRACYDEGKRAAETLFFDYWRQHDLSIKVVRLFNTYGPRMHPRDGRVVSNFVISALAGRASHHLWRRQPESVLLLCR